MSHKVHPKIFKIKEMKDWQSRGFYEKNFKQNLQEDYLIRKFLGEKLKQAAVESVEIERLRNSLRVIIKTARPALVIGRGGQEVEKIKEKLIDILKAVQSKTQKPAKRDIRIEILEVRNPWSSAVLVGQWVAGQIEKMVPFRRAMKMAKSKLLEQKDVKGVRIQMAGRLNGTDISRTEWLGEGRLPRQSQRAIIDYGLTEARCAYGTIGIKVWIYKGDKF